MHISKEDVAGIISSRYGIKVLVWLEPLPGYEETNYLVRLTRGQDSELCVVKLSCSDGCMDALQAQVALLKHLASSPVSHLIPACLFNKQGEAITIVQKQDLMDKAPGQVAADNLLLQTDAAGPVYLRIMTYLPGSPVAVRGGLTDSILQETGRALGLMDLALIGFDHCGTHRYMYWDLQHAADSFQYLNCISDPQTRRLVDYFLLQFETLVRPVLPGLRKAVIHNDANDYNILVQEGRVTGLIDFGDMVYSPLVCNLAIAMTYMMFHSDDPLCAAAMLVGAYHHANPLQHEEIAILYYLVAARLCISLIASAKSRCDGSDNPHHYITESPALKLLHAWIRISPVKAENYFKSACNDRDATTSRLDAATVAVEKQAKVDYDDLLQKRRSLIGTNLSISYQRKIKIDKGALQYLYDDLGNTYLDCVNNVSHVGHCHPRVVRAMQRQIALLNTNTRYLHDALVEYAGRLTALLPDPLCVCYFVNSGSEANDLAVRMARHFTGRKDVIVLDHAYHGNSTLAIELSPYKFDGKGGFQQPDYIHKAENPDRYRGRYTYQDPEAGRKYAQSIAGLINGLRQKNRPPAAFICETLLGVGGQMLLPEGYLKAAYEVVRSAGGVCIADEVQVGFGRVGAAFWGFELQGVVPDMVVMGKPMGNGHPLAAVVTTREIAASFDNGMEYFNTYGGNPVSMVTGLAVLDTIEAEALRENALETGRFLMGKLKGLKELFHTVADVRGSGLFIGVEFVVDRQTREPALQIINETVEKMKDRGFLLSTDGPLHNVLKIKPPLVFSRQNAFDLAVNLEEVLKEIGCP